MVVELYTKSTFTCANLKRQFTTSLSLPPEYAKTGLQCLEYAFMRRMARSIFLGSVCHNVCSLLRACALVRAFRPREPPCWKTVCGRGFWFRFLGNPTAVLLYRLFVPSSHGLYEVCVGAQFRIAGVLLRGRLGVGNTL